VLRRLEVDLAGLEVAPNDESRHFLPHQVITLRAHVIVVLIVEVA
jgi:hypothetical protein